MNTLEELLGYNQNSLVKSIIPVVILIIGFWIAKFLSRAVEYLMINRDSSKSLASLMRSLVLEISITLIIVSVISKLGVQMNVINDKNND